MNFWFCRISASLTSKMNRPDFCHIFAGFLPDFYRILASLMSKINYPDFRHIFAEFSPHFCQIFGGFFAGFLPDFCQFDVKKEPAGFLPDFCQFEVKNEPAGFWPDRTGQILNPAGPDRTGWEKPVRFQLCDELYFRGDTRINFHSWIWSTYTLLE